MKSQLFEKARCMAFNHDSLMPVDCMDILSDVYGSRLEKMKPETIVGMVKRMMQTWVDSSNLSDVIEQTVQDWCNNF